jgi:hypothetical protein
MNILNEWKGRTGVLATMHQKEQVIAPLLQAALGIEVVVPSDFNTDQFGTFTREVKRPGDQRMTARAKALAAMNHTGLDLAIASEGSFGNHPTIPFVPSNLELVLLLDAKNNLEIVGHHRTHNIAVRSERVATPEEALEVARTWGFPDQGVIVRLSEHSNRHIYKELRTEEVLRNTAETLLSKWYYRTIVLETDMRAHRCPARMESIKHATLDLIKNCTSLCPHCATPGFVVTEVIKGLPCSHCGRATDTIKATISACTKCGHTEEKSVENKTVTDPGECPWCNP